MANAYIGANNVGGRAFVNMDVAGTIAVIAVGSLYVRISARNIGALFAVRYVFMEKRGLNARFVL
jgi:hypothetical protein